MAACDASDTRSAAFVSLHGTERPRLLRFACDDMWPFGQTASGSGDDKGACFAVRGRFDVA